MSCYKVKENNETMLPLHCITQTYHQCFIFFLLACLLTMHYKSICDQKNSKIFDYQDFTSLYFVKQIHYIYKRTFIIDAFQPTPVSWTITVFICISLIKFK